MSWRAQHAYQDSAAMYDCNASFTRLAIPVQFASLQQCFIICTSEKNNNVGFGMNKSTSATS